MPSAKRMPFFYGYVVVGASFIIQLMAWGLYNTFGVFFNSFLDEFGWSRAALSGAASLCALVTGFLAIVAGRLNDRFGPRVIMLVSAFILGLAYLLLSLTTGLWQMYLFYGLVVAVGLSTMDVVLLSTVARWFTRRRGMMTGIVKVGTGAGMLVFPLAAHALISDFGWRTAYLILGALAMAVMVGFAWFMRRDPRSMGLLPDGVPVTPASRATPPGADFSLKQARRTRQFYMLCAVNMLTYFCTTTILIHIDPHAQDIGISATEAATLIATIGGVSIVGRLIMGSFGDRLGEKRGLGLCLIIFAAALASLQFLGQLWMLYLFATVYGFAHGGFFALLSPTIAELFGMRAHGIIYGFVIFSGTIGSALGPLLAGSIFDATGSYQWAFISLTVVSLTAMALTLLLKPTAARQAVP